MNQKLRRLLVGLGVVAVGVHFLPVDRSNPAVTQEVVWDSPATKSLAVRACYDCHSNETVWPWYSYVAPVSWRVAQHVRLGRAHLNFSEWDGPNEDLDEVIEEIEDGGMPLEDYLLLHEEARLSEAETTRLMEGFRATFAADPPIERQKRRPGS